MNAMNRRVHNTFGFTDDRGIVIWTQLGASTVSIAGLDAYTARALANDLIAEADRLERRDAEAAAAEDRARIAAGQAALRRAQRLGYGTYLQAAFMREAKRVHIAGRDPEATAQAVVPPPGASATDRGPFPRGAA